MYFIQKMLILSFAAAAELKINVKLGGVKKRFIFRELGPISAAPEQVLGGAINEKNYIKQPNKPPS